MCVHSEDFTSSQVSVVCPADVNKCNILTQPSLLNSFFFHKNKDQLLQSAQYPHKVRATASILLIFKNTSHKHTATQK